VRHHQGVYTGQNQMDGQAGGAQEPPGLRRPTRAPAPKRRRSRARRVLAWCAALFLLPVSVPLVFRGLDADGPAPVPQLLAFLPWFLAPAWVGLALAVLARRWPVALWAASALAATAVFLQPYGPDAPPPSGRPTVARFRVLTANLHHGDATPTLLKLLKNEHPQLAAVEECDHRCVQALRSPAVRAAYPHRIVLDEGASAGSALLSTYPLRSTTPLPGVLAMPGAYVQIEGVRVRVQVAHPMPPEFGSVTAWRRGLGELRDLAASARREGTPTLFAGDFNASQDHAAFRAVLGAGLQDTARLQGHSRTPTWPARTAPPLGVQIDHVLVGGSFEARDVGFFALPGSDHRAVLADVALRAPR
jgi:endonuclease/exonuclease/phosphatase (EEP) superfamily protein YafD